LFLACCFLLFLFVLAPSANAQCSANTIGSGDVGIVTGNPFHAEIVSTTTGAPNLPTPLFDRHPRYVARDTQGRIRTERVSREFLRDTGPDAGTKVEEHLITICDPVAKTTTQIDTATATAKILHSRTYAPRPGLAPAPPRSFCSIRMMAIHRGNVDVEDLGTQTIEGVEARGERIKMLPPDSSGTAATFTDDSVTERWCSEDLSALILTISQNTKTGRKSTVAMHNIERTEPDPQLFQIPPNYTITETVEGPPAHTNLN
jgi:hypothetical protein